MHLKTTLVAAACALGFAGTALAQNLGVSKTELKLATIQDLSGPLAPIGKQARDGMQLRVDEANEQGGINGRKIVFKVEDDGYDPKRAVLAAQKLVNQEKVFAIVGHIGTAANLATFPVMFPKKVINFLPLTAAREMYEPLNPLTYAFIAPYYQQIREAVPELVKEKKLSKVCTIYQDDEFGAEVLKGTEDGLKDIGMQLVEKASFKRGATDFSSQVAKTKAAGCDLVTLGGVIRETIGTVATSRKMGYNPVFLGSAASYSELIPKLGGKAMDGLYATMAAQVPYADDTSNKQLAFWATKYKTKYNEDGGIFSAYGYIVMDMFLQAVAKAGPNLTTDAFIKTMDGMSYPTDIFGSAPAHYTATNHLGSTAWRLSQVEDGKWKVVSPYHTK
ncbi:MAG: ABC transporter substrate-binding protein [Comamonas sp.]|nr:ABC transporter substrate-binding protein [Comamonas sp.]